MNEGSDNVKFKTSNKLSTASRFSLEFISDFSRQPLSIRESLVREGISKDLLSIIKEYFKMDYETLSKILGISTRTIHLHKGKAVFSPIISDRIVMILELYSFGAEVMGSIDAFRDWMLKPAPALMNHAPIEVVYTHPGLLEVRWMLGKFKAGQY